MVTIKTIERINYTSKTILASLFADTKQEVNSSMEIDGMFNGYTLHPGSSVVTSDAELAYLKSNGDWNWV